MSGSTPPPKWQGKGPWLKALWGGNKRWPRTSKSTHRWMAGRSLFSPSLLLTEAPAGSGGASNCISQSRNKTWPCLPRSSGPGGRGVWCEVSEREQKEVYHVSKLRRRNGEAFSRWFACRHVSGCEGWWVFIEKVRPDPSSSLWTWGIRKPTRCKRVGVWSGTRHRWKPDATGGGCLDQQSELSPFVLEKRNICSLTQAWMWRHFFRKL